MSKTNSNTIYAHNTMLVEGTDDFHSIIHLWESGGNPKQHFTARKCESVENVKSELKAILLEVASEAKSIRNLGIVVDADNDVEARWQSFLDILKESGKYDVNSTKLSHAGTIVVPKDSSAPTIGLWIMPNNKDVGMLEDFLLSLVPNDDPLLDKAEQTLTELEEANIQKYKSVHRAKAKAHTYISWQENPAWTLGEAIKSKVFNSESEYAQSFIEWLKRLFVIG